ncbi:hypothetical protein [Demequina lutea]|uniref:CBS-domain-containing membrane protein n=1 Tax=Demequina lutea TaxID=431489 RepID=A0A7Z0CJT6_9MICO|nr:hypothetical protein [Demequina lutea]NYI41218.1 CBS-domain-containing membrane protein [Demequina lutea]
MSNSVSAGHTGSRDLKYSPYANGVGAAVLAAVGAMSIIWCTTSTTFSHKFATLAILGAGQVVVYQLANDLLSRYRTVSSVALLSALLSAVVPGLFQTTPVSTGAALALAAAGSLPMWAVAVWRLALAHRADLPT